MALYTGTQDAAALLLVKSGTAVTYGLDRIAAVVQAEIAAQTAAMNAGVAGIAEITTERATTYGMGSAGKAQKVNEHGRAATQSPGEPSPVGFPLEKHQYPIGYTANYLKTATPADVISNTLAATNSLYENVQAEIRYAFFGATNRDFRDGLIDRQVLKVKALVNGDGASIPSHMGISFDGSTHGHYEAIDWTNATADQKAAKLDAAVADLVEHGHGDGVRVTINPADAGSFTSTGVPGFVPNQPTNIVVGSGTATTTIALDTTQTQNRSIGVYKGYEVVTRTWVPAGYIAIYATGDRRKPLAFRQRTDTTLQGFQLVATNIAYPLQADFMEVEFGMGALTRTNGVALYLGGGSYVSPAAP